MLVEDAAGETKSGRPVVETGGTEDGTLELLMAFVAERGLELEGFGEEGASLIRVLVDYGLGETDVGFPPFRGGFRIDGGSLSFVGTVMPSDRSEGVCGDLRGWFHAALS